MLDINLRDLNTLEKVLAERIERLQTDIHFLHDRLAKVDYRQRELIHLVRALPTKPVSKELSILKTFIKAPWFLQGVIFVALLASNIGLVQAIRIALSL